MKFSNSPIPQEELLLIGVISGVHGIRGVVKVASYAESPDIFGPDHSLMVVDARGKTHTHIIEWVKPHKQGLLMALKQVTTRDGAEALVHSEIYVRKTDLPELEEGTYYWFELVGLAVFDKDERFLGRIRSVFTTGSNDVYVVTDETRGEAYEVMIPALASVVRSVDLSNKIMRVDLPDGLVSEHRRPDSQLPVH